MLKKGKVQRTMGQTSLRELAPLIVSRAGPWSPLERRVPDGAGRRLVLETGCGREDPIFALLD